MTSMVSASKLLEVPDEVLERLRKAGNLGKRYTLIGFSGWPDAGNVASLTVQHIIDSLSPEKLMEFETADFQDLTVSRPTVEIDDGLIKELSFAESALYLWSDPEQDASLLILKSPEPGFYWKAFSKNILDLCGAMSAQRVYLVGGVLDMIPHTRGPRISAVVNMEHLKMEVKIHGITPSNYRGPASIHSYLLMRAREVGLEAISIWGHVPSYVPYPNAIVAFHVASRLAEMMEISINLDKLARLAEELRRRIDGAVEENPELRGIVRELEKRYDQESGAPPYIT